MTAPVLWRRAGAAGTLSGRDTTVPSNLFLPCPASPVDGLAGGSGASAAVAAKGITTIITLDTDGDGVQGQTTIMTTHHALFASGILILA